MLFRSDAADVLARLLGLLFDRCAHDRARRRVKRNLPVIIRIGATFNSIFGNFLGFCIPLIIIGFVAPGIADLGQGAGKTLAITAGIAYLSTIIAGSFAYAVDSALFPTFLKVGSIVMDNAQNAEDTMLAGLFTVEMPPLMGVMTALITSFIMGIGIAAFNAVYEKYFVSKPARSCVAVRELPKQLLCEIEVIAVVE